MADVTVRVVRTLEDMSRGDVARVPWTDSVAAMVAGGYWEVIERHDVPVKAVKRGKNQAEPVGDDGDV
jgi:hypothetical protein